MTASRASADYAYLHVRVSVLAAQLLPPASEEMLIGAPPEQERVLLQGVGLTPFGESLSDDPKLLEQALIDALLADFTVLARALSGPPRELLVYWARRFELSNLKAIIRGKMTEQPAEKIRGLLLDIGSFATLPLDDLLRSDDVAELLRRLEATPYADIARPARRIYEGQQGLFALDAAMDRRYLSALRKHVGALDANEQRLLRRLVGAILDRFNLVWLLRYRFAYDLPAAEAYYLLIPGGYRLLGADLQALAQLRSFEEVLANLPEPLARDLAQASCATTVDRLMEAQVGRLAEHILRHTAFNLARAFAYLVLREHNLLHLHAVLKGKRLHMKPETIRLALWAPLTAMDMADRGVAARPG